MKNRASYTLEIFKIVFSLFFIWLSLHSSFFYDLFYHFFISGIIFSSFLNHVFFIFSFFLICSFFSFFIIFASSGAKKQNFEHCNILRFFHFLKHFSSLWLPVAQRFSKK